MAGAGHPLFVFVRRRDKGNPLFTPLWGAGDHPLGLGNSG